MSNTTVVYAGDNLSERLIHNTVGQLALSAVHSAHQVLTQFYIHSSTLVAESLELTKKVIDLTIPETDLLNTQIDPKYPNLPIYLSAEITKAIIEALVAAEDDLLIVDTGEGEQSLEKVRRALRATGRRLIDRGGRRGWLPLDIWVVAFEDDLTDYTFPENLAGKIESIREVRFFDRNSITHLCSFEGSYWCRLLDFQVTLKPEFADDDELRDAAYEWVVEANREAKDDYQDQRWTDRLIEGNKPGTIYHYGNPGFDLDEAIESARESLRSGVYNHSRQRGLPHDSATIAKLVAQAFKDPQEAEQRGIDVILDSVYENLRANAVL